MLTSGEDDGPAVGCGTKWCGSRGRCILMASSDEGSVDWKAVEVDQTLKGDAMDLRRTRPSLEQYDQDSLSHDVCPEE
jgi:hypothetical protein